MPTSLAVQMVAADNPESIEELLQLWKPDCYLMYEGLDAEECPSCFGGNIKTIFDEAGAHLQCGGCGVIGATFDLKPGR